MSETGIRTQHGHIEGPSQTYISGNQKSIDQTDFISPHILKKIDFFIRVDQDQSIRFELLKYLFFICQRQVKNNHMVRMLYLTFQKNRFLIDAQKSDHWSTTALSPEE